MSEPTIVYTDGACRGNPGPGGWAWVVPDGPNANGFEPDTTNQRMELLAVLEATRSLGGALHIVSDSTYVVNCFRDGWWKGWLSRGWVNSAKKPVANRDLWEPLVDVFQDRELSFEWVKGHSGDRWNEEADQLAVAAIEDAVGPRTGATAAIVGHGLLVGGHQPPQIGGYEPNPQADDIRRRLTEIIAAKAELHDDLVVVSGLRLGAEQLGAEAALDAGVPLVAVLPYPSADARWPSGARRRFAELQDAAREVRVLQKTEPATQRDAGAAMSRRDGWLARAVAEAVMVWDGQDRRLGAVVRALERELGDDVWIVDPGIQRS